MKYLAISLILFFSAPAFADPSVIKAVNSQQSGNTWKFDVTVSHPDSGWDHYVDGWRILDMQGNELGMRILHHPHVDEQPFTRSLSGVLIPAGTQKIQVQARCNVDGWDAKKYTVTLP